MAKKTSRGGAPKAGSKTGRAVGNVGGVAVPKPNNPMNLPGMPNRPQK